MESNTPQTLEEWTEQVKKDISQNRVFVYAKGEKNAPVCGFSAQVMQILNHIGVDYEVRNIFSHEQVKPAIQAHTNWPTTPQIFIDGEFIGGCDILTELFQSGELQKKLGRTAAQ